MTDHFETHLTLGQTDPHFLDPIRDWAEARGWKWTQIVLDSGSTPLQPMLTFWGTGSAQTQLDQAQKISAEVLHRHGTIIRIKIEASLENSIIPQNDQDLPPDSPDYFEHHVKILLPDPSRLELLSECAHICAARLSSNSRRTRSDGRIERFVTQRISGHGATTARTELNRLLNTLTNSSFEILEVESEFVIYDSNLHLDAGWLDDQPQSSRDQSQSTRE